jgi:hypothetical protein
MQAQAYDGYFEDGRFFTAGRTIKIPERQRVFLTVLDEPVIDTDKQRQARQALKDVFRVVR